MASSSHASLNRRLHRRIIKPDLLLRNGFFYEDQPIVKELEDLLFDGQADKEITLTNFVSIAKAVDTIVRNHPRLVSPSDRERIRADVDIVLLELAMKISPNLTGYLGNDFFSLSPRERFNQLLIARNEQRFCQLLAQDFSFAEQFLLISVGYNPNLINGLMENRLGQHFLMHQAEEKKGLPGNRSNRPEGAPVRLGDHAHRRIIPDGKQRELQFVREINEQNR